MAFRIDIKYKIEDARAKVREIKFRELLVSPSKINSVAVVDSYTIDGAINSKDIKKVIDVFTNHFLEEASIHPGKLLGSFKFNWAIEIGFLPGVTDNVATTARETIEDLLGKKFKKGESVYTAQTFYISGKLTADETKNIANSLYNPLIQSARIKSFAQFKKDKGMGIHIPKVNLKTKPKVSLVDLDVSDEELIKIGKQGIVDPDTGISRGPLALDLDYMKAIRSYFNSKKRKPTDVEMESIAQTWSEHCKHTIFANPIDEIKNGLYKSYIKEATKIIRAKKGKKDFCVSVFTDNAGAIVFDDKYLVTHKVETHNSPSALDPFGGAITGIVGVNRDALGFGYGAKPVANVYGFCLGNPDDTRPLYRDRQKLQKMLPPKRIMEGVIAGVNVGGNCSGIPTAEGFLYFNDRYRGKPLVFVGTVGLIPRKVAGHSSTEKEAKNGDYVVMMGGRVGQDGIHGATFSSEQMDQGSPATAVQIGDPITQKKLSDAIVKEARYLGLYTSITDNGAGGISCSVAEMAKECGGCLVELEKVPLKYPGLEPWQIWISESQERMTLSVPKNKWKDFSKLMERRGVEATIIGQFNNSGKCVVTYHKKKIMDVDLEFLHNGLPKRELKTRKEDSEFLEPPTQKAKDLSPVLNSILKRLNIASYEFISNQYDHEVQGSSVIKPLQGKGRVNGDVAVLRPVPGSNKGVILSSALNPSYSEIDSYAMAASSIDEAIREVIAAGGDMEHIALLDNFCWCNSTDPVRLYQLKNAVKACYDYSILYGTPLISGKDSMFNDFKGFDENGDQIYISIPPTLLISSIGIIQDASKAISIDFKFAGDIVYVLGDTSEELSGSEYFQYLGEKDGKRYKSLKIPQVDGLRNKKLYQAFGRASRAGIVSSAESIGRGGVAVALSKGAMAGKLGADITLAKIGSKTSQDDLTLFSENSGRILASIDPKNKNKFEKMLKGHFHEIGKVSASDSLLIRGVNGKRIVKLKIVNALTSYRSTFKNY